MGRLLLFVALFCSPVQLLPQFIVLPVEQLTVKDGLPHNSVQSVKQDKFGFMWFSSFAGLSRYDGYSFRQYLPDPDNEKAILSRGIYNLVKDSLDNIWVAFIDTTIICRYNYDSDDFTRFIRADVDEGIKDKIHRNRLNPLVAENSLESVWEYSDGLLHKHDISSNLSTLYCLKFPYNQVLPSDFVKAMYLDKYGVLWFGTESQGLFKVNTNTKPFYTFLSGEGICKGMFNEIIRAIYEDQENRLLWIGTQHNGILCYNRNSGHFEFIRENAGDLTNGLVSSHIRAIEKDDQGSIWIGTKGGLSIYDPLTRKFRNHLVRSEKPIPHNWVHAILKDYMGTMWIGTFDGIARYIHETDSFVKLPSGWLLNSRVSGIIEDFNFNLWVATQGGGVTCLRRQLHSNGFIPVHYTNQPNNPNSLSSNRVFNLVEDEDGYIWAGTDFGLNRIDPYTNEVIRFTLKDGLPNETVAGVLADGDNHIWVSHKSGLTRIHRNTFEMRHFTENDGLLSNDFAENAFFRNPATDEMFFGSVEGVNYFSPDEILDNYVLPDPVFTDLQVLNREVLPRMEINGSVILQKPLVLSQGFSLRNTHKSFSIGFAALHFVNPQAVKYKYKLEGFDQDWITVGAGQRRATYSNLKAGNYSFKLMVANNDGIWNPNPIEMSIEVLPPWWNTYWAYLIFLLLTGGMLHWVYQSISFKERMKGELIYEQMKSKKLAELDKMKLQFFTNVSHELRTPLSLIADPLHKLSKGLVDSARTKEYYDLIYRNANRLTVLVNQLLDFSKVGNKKAEAHYQDMDVIAFIKMITDSFHLSAGFKNIDFQYKACKSELIAKIDTDKMEKIVVNLLSNAFKFTAENGSINLNLDVVNEIGSDHKSNDFIEIRVADTGIGIPGQSLDKVFDVFYQAELPKGLRSSGSGIGLAYTRELVELLDGNISVESKENIGTIFIVKLPLIPGQLQDVDPIPVQMNPSLLSFNEKAAGPETENDVDDGRLTVLVVDDNEDMRSYLGIELSEVYQVVEATNGSEAWQKVLTMVPDVILSDVMMPEINGFELCRLVKCDKRTSHIPVVLLTARHSEKYFVEGYETGADAYIVKPFNSLVLLAQIKNLIESRQKLAAVFGKSPFPDIKKIAGNSADEFFINKAIEVIEENIKEPEFNIDFLAEGLQMNRRQLSRKIKALTDQTVNEFVKTIRLNKAAELLITTDKNISEVAFSLGYNIPANFSRSFTSQFGTSPTEYVHSMLSKKKADLG